MAEFAAREKREIPTSRMASLLARMARSQLSHNGQIIGFIPLFRGLSVALWRQNETYLPVGFRPKSAVARHWLRPLACIWNITG